MSVKDYIDTIAPAPAVLKAIQADGKRKGFDKLSMRRIDALIAEERQFRPAKKSRQRTGID